MSRWFGIGLSLVFIQVPSGAWGVVSPVVVELFESQGCSSCPPAERVMESLEKEFGSGVILLTYHVHYWDDLGWKDSFSDSRYTQLQSDYARAFGQDNIYTPEMVVQGETGFLGSDLLRARQEIQSRIHASRPAVVLQLQPGPERSAKLYVKGITDSAAGDLLAVIFENTGPVEISRGENKGETMSGRFAVRNIVPLTTEAAIVKFLLRRNPSWNPRKLGVAVLVRDGRHKIQSAATAPWPHAS